MLRSMYSRACVIPASSASDWLANRVSRTGRSMIFSPVGDSCLMDDTTAQRPSAICSLTTLMLHSAFTATCLRSIMLHLASHGWVEIATRSACTIDASDFEHTVSADPHGLFRLQRNNHARGPRPAQRGPDARRRPSQRRRGPCSAARAAVLAAGDLAGGRTA